MRRAVDLDVVHRHREVEVATAELKERYGLDDEALVDQINLLNLVNFGGGCYAVYAELKGDVIRVDKVGVPTASLGDSTGPLSI